MRIGCYLMLVVYLCSYLLKMKFLKPKLERKEYMIKGANPKGCNRVHGDQCIYY